MKLKNNTIQKILVFLYLCCSITQMHSMVSDQEHARRQHLYAEERVMQMPADLVSHSVLPFLSSSDLARVRRVASLLYRLIEDLRSNPDFLAFYFRRPMGDLGQARDYLLGQWRQLRGAQKQYAKRDYSRAALKFAGEIWLLLKQFPEAPVMPRIVGGESVEASFLDFILREKCENVILYALLNSPDVLAQHPLHLVLDTHQAPIRQRTIIFALLRSGLIDVNERNINNETILHRAVHSDDTQLFNILLTVEKVLKSLNAQDAHGNTVLHLAAMKGNESMIYPLLGAGADKTIRNNNNQQPYECTDDPEIREMLRVSARAPQHVEQRHQQHAPQVQQTQCCTIQ